MKLIFKLVLIAGIISLYSCGSDSNGDKESSENSKGLSGANTYDTSRVNADTLTPQETAPDTFPAEPEKKDSLK